MQKISFTCPLCGHQLTLAASLEGRQGKCPGCKQVVTIRSQPVVNLDSPVVPVPVAPQPIPPPALQLPAVTQAAAPAVPFPASTPIHAATPPLPVNSPGDDTILIHQVFADSPPWPLSQQNVPVTLTHAPDGNPVYQVVIGDIGISCYEITAWNEGTQSSYSPRRLVMITYFEGVEITDAMLLLGSNTVTRGLPSFGVDPEDGIPSAQISIPIVPGLPCEVLRSQVLIAIGLLAEEAADLWQSIEEGGSSHSAANVASIVGSLLGGLARGFVEG